MQCEENGWKCTVFPVEVGCRGFVGHSTLKFLATIGTTPQIKKKVTRKLQQAAEKASTWIWSKREASENHHPPGSAVMHCWGRPHMITPTGIGPERRCGFQLKMVGD